MAIEIKEYLGAKFTYSQDRSSFNPAGMNFTEAAQYSNRVAPNSLNVEIEGLHTVVTRNDTLYTDAAQKKAAPLWTQPYERPVIMHHNETEGVTIGRVKSAYHTDVDTRSGTGATRFIVNIGHKDGIEGINNGTLGTVSVGLIANEVRCSICNQDLASEGECEHERGAYYDGKKCVWIIHDFEPKELSFVIVPSDPFAHILRVEKVEDTTSKKNIKENLNTKEVKNMHGTWDSLIEEGNKILAESAASKKEAPKAKKEDEKEKEEDAKKVEGEENDNDDVRDENKATESDDESGKQEDEGKEEKSSADEQGEGHTESEIEEKESEKTEEKSEDEEGSKADDNKAEDETEKNVTPKPLEEDHQKDIDNKKADIYKDIESDLAAEKEANKALQSELETLKKEIAKLKTNLTTEKQLKESAEQQLMVFKTEKKKALVEQVNKLRTDLNLNPEDANSLMEASEESLQFSIKNLKEFSTMSVNIPKVESPLAINESKDNTIKKISDVKESAKDSNIEFEGPDALVKIFSEAMTGQNGFGF